MASSSVSSNRVSSPARLNKQSSTRSATSENRAKFVPMPSYVAPSGYGVPGQICMGILRLTSLGSAPAAQASGGLFARRPGGRLGGFRRPVLAVAEAGTGAVLVPALPAGLADHQQITCLLYTSPSPRD